ncbi:MULTISPECIES: hypothetical protein [unclassified Streptomyces]|uniref:hypothetical protein n=1 Tax=unclassified Streptomyces TaxID=2593676 RepID=UPI00034EAC7B|nr:MULTISPECIES: hypothetical protein [unclassified Streptomyces]EPD63546.1 hypothetical protein HMPREF1211_02673 [Streptomyces sp. HGB0020]WUB41107.1 hypothetical protein OHN38_41770 [Streptomyces sp. NBC_00588]
MNKKLNGVSAEDGAPVPAEEIPAALTAGRLVYTDGATQTFDSDGTTRYVEGGRETEGTWFVDDTGHFCSFWPPSYRASYDLRWVAEGGEAVGLRFSDLRSGSRFEGRYQ